MTDVMLAESGAADTAGPGAGEAPPAELKGGDHPVSATDKPNSPAFKMSKLDPLAFETITTHPSTTTSLWTVGTTSPSTSTRPCIHHHILAQS